MLQAIVQSHDPLGKFWSAFHEAFRTRPQYRHFQAYVVALLIYLGSHNLAGLSPPRGTRFYRPSQQRR